ncbi:hypothetical protein Tco_0634900 [Tanacetum coccineum]
MENTKKGDQPMTSWDKDYCRIVMYAMTCTRPDVSYVLIIGEKELRVTGYCNASWQTVKDDSHSQSGWVFLLNRGAVTWKSSKQDTVQTPHASSGILQLVRLRRKLSR